MSILHISSYYPGSDLYRQMLTHFSSVMQHIMYVPVAKGNPVRKREMRDLGNVQVMYSEDFLHSDRWRYHRKKNKIERGLQEQVELNNISLLHAHHLFTAGGPAFGLAKKFGIPYIVAVRNTDINLFFRYALHLRRFGLSVLEGASKIVLVSSSGFKGLKQRIPKNLWNRISSKTVIIPNGIDDFWLTNTSRKTEPWSGKQLRILFVGKLNRNKGVRTLLATAEELTRRGHIVELDIVGDGPETQRINRWRGRNAIRTRMYGYVEDKAKLRDLYRRADVFLMPSSRETFGLVYIEAISQGLPILYTAGTGVDGCFEPGEVGLSIDRADPTHIADQVEAVLSSSIDVSTRCVKAAGRFRWSNISSRYEDLYRVVGSEFDGTLVSGTS